MKLINKARLFKKRTNRLMAWQLHIFDSKLNTHSTYVHAHKLARHDSQGAKHEQIRMIKQSEFKQFKGKKDILRETNNPQLITNQFKPNAF
ncbi:hypothetical protein R3W88_025087 [Solanum pinnatisectum]|uniref:Uncharacterized protein n=1 Tax=Solanum pinnatisectum TaxID=50273 RepID=A0AAV9M2H2_9SOLN|nr:hypothetical protein R3W88_025087 [Solanum pinnatisectum]